VTATPGPAGDATEKRLDIILADYQACREDERVLFSIQAGIFSVAVTLIGLMAAAVTQTCQFSANKSSCVHIPDYLLAGTPLIPIALLAYTTILGVRGTIRSYYMRGLEAEIRKYVASPIASLGEVKPASFMGITLEIESLRRGALSYRLLTNLIFVAVILIFGGFTAYIGFHVGTAEQVGMAMAYTGIAIVLVWQVYLGTVGGRGFFVDAAQRFLVHGASLPQIHPPPRARPAPPERSLLSYLLFPRPEDWVKWVIAPGAFLAASWSVGTLRHWPQFLALWLILEYLIYEARYQWNDVRGLGEDLAHPDQIARGRLPIGPTRRTARRNIMLSLTVAAGRVVLALLIGWALGLAGPVAILIGIVFGIALGYESLRSERSPAAASAGSAARTPSSVIAAIWVIVGFGYGVRSGLGFLTGGLPLRSWQLWTGILCFTALGVVFVQLTWVLEAADCCWLTGDGQWKVKARVRTKAHVMRLLDLVPGRVDPVPAGKPPPVGYRDGRDVQVLSKRGSLRAPWNFAMAISAAAGGALGAALAHATPSPTAVALTVVLSLGFAMVLMRCSTGSERALSAVAGTVVIIGVTTAFGRWPVLLLAGAPWLTISLIYFFFRGSSYADLLDFGPRLLAAFRSVRIVFYGARVMLRLIVGSGTWNTFTAARTTDRRPGTRGTSRRNERG
jgi:hypothetical protein